jgi:hypothetical protein
MEPITLKRPPINQMKGNAALYVVVGLTLCGTSIAFFNEWFRKPKMQKM